MSKNDDVCEVFKARLNTAAGQYSYRELGRLTGVHPETVRRYMQGHAPSAVFLSKLCEALGISGEWLLTGHGPMKSTDICSAALRGASVKDLLQALSVSMTRQEHQIGELQNAVERIQQSSNVRSTEPSSCSDRPRAKKLNQFSEPKGRSETPGVTGNQSAA